MEDFLQQLPRNLFLYIGAGIFALIVTYKFFPKVFLKIHKPFFFTLGILSLSLGYVGILIPGLPTTVFILIAAWAFSKCSDRFTAWLENHRLFGPMILNWKTLIQTLRYFRPFDQKRTNKLSEQVFWKAVST